MVTEVRGITDRMQECDRTGVLNEASGDLVLSRYGPVLASHVTDPNRRAHLLESVESDAGTLVFPMFDRFILPAIRAYGRWEPEEGDHLRSCLSPGMQVLDVGANVGYTALVMAGAVGDQGLVIALEPEPFNFQLLCLNLSRNGADNVIPIHTAAGERTGSIELERSFDNTGDHRTGPHPVGIAGIGVPMIALDDLLPADQAIDFVFVDAQGYDHRVLMGMTKTIERCRPPMLVEFWPVGILGLGDDPDEVLRTYRGMGYRIELLPNTDVTRLSAAEVVGHSEKDHVTLSLVPETEG
jgi:FkbM family methyltransferase